MEQFKHQNGNGSIFKNKFKTTDTHPDYRGTLVLQDGTEQEIALWVKDGKSGDKFFSAKLSDPYKKAGAPSQPQQAQVNGDLPF